MLGSVPFAEKRGARFASQALVRFRVSAQSAERAAQIARDIRRTLRAWKRENDLEGTGPCGGRALMSEVGTPASPAGFPRLQPLVRSA
jgi:hypothetical protein